MCYDPRMKWSYRLTLLTLFAIAFAISCYKPPHLFDFVIEHAMTVVFLTAVIVLDRKKPFTKISLTLIFIYSLLHVLGAHYTYSEVPYDLWSANLFGQTLRETFGWQRNHYDRLIHFLFGVLMVYPMRELLQRVLPELRDGRLLLIAVMVVALGSKLYELLEWAYTMVLSDTDAARYNGEQGDHYDAQKDMAMALVGSIISAVVIYVLERRRGSVPISSGERG